VALGLESGPTQMTSGLG